MRQYDNATPDIRQTVHRTHRCTRLPEEPTNHKTMVRARRYRCHTITSNTPQTFQHMTASRDDASNCWLHTLRLRCSRPSRIYIIPSKHYATRASCRKEGCDTLSPRSTPTLTASSTTVS